MLSFAAFMAGAVYATDFLARPALTGAIANPVTREVLIVLGLAGVMAVFGAAQALLLRPYLAGAEIWGAVTAITLWAGGSLIELAFAAGIAQTLSIVVGALLFGPGCATVQFFILRRQVRRAGWWVLAWSLNWIVVFIVAAAVGLGTQAVLHNDFDSSLTAYYGAGGLVGGALSGVVLAWLLGATGSSGRGREAAAAPR